MSSKPIIGVPACRKGINGQPFHAVGEKYLRALIDGAGALPLIMPVMAEHLGMDELLAEVDGVFLTGSISNVEPHRYGGGSSDPGTPHDPARDAATLPLTRRALETGVPLMAVCRGFQEVVVALGGSLHQKVHEVPGYHSHKEDPDDPLDVQYGPSHEVNLVEGGVLHGLAGGGKVMVNSLHSQGVARLPDGVTVEAVADDGLIEAFTVDSVPGFSMAVQWHPEWQVTKNPFSMAIFKAFGDACRAFASRRQV
ncbi:MAG TPA: gamma-glutamyl-gamma-aminobutyrate hydrolase family protein [Woeseiaceae bacterium]|jgi:putative glutamine amidotransferase|nr:gamma-glutamyl-gamma-aminobutyrate hydrolase family protein [Woeseiaceae bacterium]